MSLRDRSVRMVAFSVLVVSTYAASLALAQTPPTDFGEPTEELSTQESARQTLRTRISLRAEEAALSDVLTHLETITRIRFEPVWVEAQHAGIDPEALVTIDAEKRPLQEVLERIIEQIGDDFDQVAWQIGEDGRVQIGPKSRLNERTTIVIYDLNDVLFDIPDFVNVPMLDLQSATQQGQGSSQMPFQGAGETEQLQPSVRGPDEIVDLITTFVEPDQWQRNGGEGALMRVWNNQLIVRAPRYVLRGIDGLL